VAAGSVSAAVGDEIVAAVRDQFFDAARGRAWAEQHAGYGAAAKDAADFERLTNAALTELKASHTAYFAADTLANLELRSLYASILKGPEPEIESLGIDYARLPGGFFARHVFAGGGAAAAGVRRGDRIVSADGKPFDPVASLRGKDGQPVVLEIERTRGAPPVKLTATPRKQKPAAEWLAAQEAGSAVVERAGKRVAYTYMYSCATNAPLDLVQKTMRERFADADALVIDIRDGWGGCPPEFLNLFNPRLPKLGFVDRDGKEHVWFRPWDKPVVLVTNGNTRSGKEIVAFEFRKHAIGPIVGERTAGAFLAGRPIPLSDGSTLYVAVARSKVDGVALERNGVPATVEVPDALPYAAGADPQRDRALDVAAELASRPVEHHH
jgi:carboxyl-terminal processing protease